MTYSQSKSLFFLHVVVFLYFFMPFVSVGEMVLHLPYYFHLTFTLYFLYCFLIRKVSAKYFLIFFLFSVPYAWVLMVSLLNGNVDKTIQLDFLNSYLRIFSAFGISVLIVARLGSKSLRFLVKSVYYAGVVHALIMSLSFFYGPAREFLYSFVILGDNGQRFIEGLVRSPGLTTSGGDALSVLQASSLVFGLYYVFIEKSKITFWSFILNFLSFSLILLSVLLSARTGLVVVLLGIIVVFGQKAIAMSMKYEVNRDALNKMMLVAFSLLFLPALYFFLAGSEYDRFVRRAFEIFINFFDHGYIGTSSSDHLKTMFFLPGDLFHFLIGDGNFGRDESLEFVDSDVGYVRVWFGSGFLGVLFFYTPIVFILGAMFKDAVFCGVFPLLFYIVAMILVVNIKVYHLYSSASGFALLLIFVSVIISNRSVSSSKRNAIEGCSG